MKDRKLKRFFPILLVLTIIFSTTSSFAKLNLPSPTKEFYYYDEMGVISEDLKSEIIKTNVELQGKTKAQVVVATVNDLQQYPIEEYALEMFRKWGIGDKERNNGVLILLGKEPTNDKYSIYIATGYGLEGRLNDGKVGRIIDEFFIPNINRDDPTSFNEGLRETFRAVVSQVILEYDVELDGDYEKYMDRLDSHEEVNGWVILLIIIILILLSRYRTPRGPRGRGYRRGYSPWSFGGFSGSSGSSGGFGGFSGGGGSSGGGGAGRSF